MGKIKVSIIIPVRNEEKFIFKCLDSLISQSFPKKNMEVFFIDGMSTDKTREILKEYNVEFLDNPKKIKSAALNIGIKKSIGEYIIILDAHAEYKKDYISKCVKYSKKYNVAVIGGAMKTKAFKNTLIAKSIAISLSHCFGVNSQFRKETNAIFEVDTVFSGCYQRKIFEKVGYYNEKFIRSQDMELSLRIKKAGGKILLIPDIISYYYPKSTLQEFFQHNIQDGIWAIYPLKFNVPLKIRHYLPLIFILFLPISIWPYMIASIFFSLQIAWKQKDLRYAFTLPLVFAARHFGYGIGSIFGIIKLLQKGNKKIKLHESELVQKLKKFWYSNTLGTFDFDNEKITRKEIFTYGGPNSLFTCPICQKLEWLSRIKQKNLFVFHACPQILECKKLCSYQGDEAWTHYHQNFNFMFGNDSTLPAPKCLYLNDVPNKAYKNFIVPRCDQGERIFKRLWAYTCQVDRVQKIVDIDWSKYDFLFIDITGCKQRFSRPNIPIILYGHDCWGYNPKTFQSIIDWLQPDMFLTSYPTQWKEKFKFPSKTKISFFPLFPSLFFTRSNLDDKKFDLLVIGATSSNMYKERISLDKQISKLDNYKIEFSHKTGYLGSKQKKENHFYLNKWSEYIASSRYVIFGRAKHPIVFWKYYETLGSGAIPIFPEVPDLKLLGIKPFEHYIPLSAVEGNNDMLTYYLNHYDDYKYIAQNSIAWYNKNADKIFEKFEDKIHQVIIKKYKKRII